MKTRKPKKKTITILAVVCSLMVIIVFVSVNLKSERRFPLTAAIVDQLAEHFPNENFRINITTMLTNEGFSLTYYNSSELTIEFLKELPRKNYGIIILRVHFALRNDSSTVDMFTSEKYREDAYINELHDGLLSIGKYNIEGISNESYFAITSEFIKKEMKGVFPNSIIIAMGCWSIRPFADHLARAFLEKNALAYIGWSNIVLLDDTDYEVTKLLKTLLTQNKTIAQAINETKTYEYIAEGGIKIPTRLSYLPYEAGNLVLQKLIVERKTSEKLASNIIIHTIALKSKSKKPNINLIIEDYSTKL